MSRTQKIKILSLLVFGFIFVFKNYVIVIGQTAKPVLVALNKADSTLAIIDPSTMKVIAKVATGDSPHEVVLSADGKTAFVANYGAQAPGSSISVIDSGSKDHGRGTGQHQRTANSWQAARPCAGRDGRVATEGPAR